MNVPGLSMLRRQSIEPLKIALRERIGENVRNEFEQSLIRVAVGSIVQFYIFSSAFSAFVAEDAFLQITRSVSTVFVLFSFLLLGWILFRPGKSVVRRLIGISGDVSAASAGLYFGGEGGAPLIAIYLWISMGNGFRFGPNYLAFSTVLSVVQFALVAFFNAYWSAHAVFTASMLIVIAILPLYMAILLKKLNDAIRRANEASKAKSQFVANMSHELRTPLNGVIATSDLLVDMDLKEEQLELANTIRSSADTLLGLIENILDFSRIEAGRLAIDHSDFDLHELVASVSHMFESQALKKGLTLCTHVSPRVRFLLKGDALHLRQVLINLVGNAMKFTEKGQIELRVSPTETSAGESRIRFEVVDTGIGISSKDKERIFESFEQADPSTTRRFGGTGLGTAIARQLVELMGGCIGLESQLGEGTRFWFELPFEEQEYSAAEPEGQLRDTRVLLLTGKATGDRLSGFFGHWNLEHITRSETSARAFSQLIAASDNNRPYSIVIVEAAHLDIGLDQFSVMVKSEPLLRHLPLVLITDDSLSEGHSRLFNADYSAILEKPLDKALLFNAIHAARAEYEVPENVISLAERYEQQLEGKNSRLQILVAEDNATNQKVLRRILERVGHDVSVATDGEAALDMLEGRTRHFDLLILDLNMPRLGGLDVVKAFRFMDPQANTPVIVLTADATTEALQACKEAGVDTYLTKPIQAHKLLSAVAAVNRSKPEKPDRTQFVKPSVSKDRYECNATVDQEVLKSLVGLGSDTTFFEDLVDGFVSDGQRNLEKMGHAIQQRDYPAFSSAIHALKGSASELGATELVRLSKEARKLKPYEMETDRPGALLATMKNALDTTSRLLTEYAQARRDAPGDCPKHQVLLPMA